MSNGDPDLVLSGARAATGAGIFAVGGTVMFTCLWKAFSSDPDSLGLGYIAGCLVSYTVTVLLVTLVMSGSV